MEFNFRAGDQQQPPTPKYHFPRPSAVYCFSKQGFTDACFRRSTNSNITLRMPFDMYGSMHCEMELIRLREEKLLMEIERQRLLKEEARIKLMLFEREIAIRGVAQSVSYSFREQHRWGATATAPSPVVQPFHELQEMQPQVQPRGSDRVVFGAMVLPPRAQPFTAEEKKEADKKELIVLEKPDPNVFREKQKAEMPSTMDKPLGVKKNPKDEWSCALCQVSVPSERTFNQHLHGKKHKCKEAGLMAQKASKRNVSQAAPKPLPNKRRKVLKVTEPFGSSAGGKEDKQQNELAIEQNSITENVLEKKKFKFWCEKCKVGAFTKDVMVAHLHGKKHQAGLQEVVGQKEK